MAVTMLISYQMVLVVLKEILEGEEVFLVFLLEMVVKRWLKFCKQKPPVVSQAVV